MKKTLAIGCFFALGGFASQAQQLPGYTQYPSQFFLINPAYTGTKTNIDFRLNYRKQWSGFTDAPETKTTALHSRFLKGKLGAGGMVSTDETGPTKRFTYGFMAAYHLRFPDVELSAGIGINFISYTFDATRVTIHNSHDPAIDRALSEKEKMKNMTGGVLLYNDRFHFGLGVLNIADSKVEFYLSDTLKKATVKYKQHYYFNVGYNFNYHPDFIWENNLMVNYVVGAPMTIDYNLRVHIREKFLVGPVWRLKDAVALQAGMVFLKKFQVIYSYDLTISKLRKYNSGSHEITLGYKQDFNGNGKNGYRNYEDFQRQKFNLF
ncbi:MAG: Bacteroidetes-specific putative membrane protein [Bacteroidetes bacterium]|nr:MAG: Bacteroidetes-specific putative membrane protein [Bacteroidota bacterium]